MHSIPKNISSENPQYGPDIRSAKEAYYWRGPEANDSALAMKFIEKASDVRQIDKLVRDSSYRPYWIAFAA